MPGCRPSSQVFPPRETGSYIVYVEAITASIQITVKGEHSAESTEIMHQHVP
jgi:hypothetical protein